MEQKLKRQLEFYFSDANLSRDIWLCTKIHESKDYYIPLETIMNFNKIKALTDDKELVLKICRESSILQIDETNTFIRRSKPFKKKTKQQSSMCQVYIEGVPLDYNVEDIENTFSYLGHIVYVTMRKTERKFNGTIFIEFRNSKEAIEACSKIQGPYNIVYFPLWLVDFRKKNGTYKKTYADVLK